MTLSPSFTSAKPVAKPKAFVNVKQAVEEIRKDCGITTGQFTYSDQKISVNYDGMIEPEKLDCATEAAILRGIDFDSYDASAPYSGPRRFILKGATKRVIAVEQEAVTAEWIVVRGSDAGDGISYLEIEPPAGGSRRDVRMFLDRFGNGNLADVAIGISPRTIYGHDKPSTGASFRHSARAIYGALRNRSCGAPPEFRRDELLQP
ncbi:MAG: hypothetical protein LH610_04875, partial [Sphingomonas bacterium]|nr:hypothetical protein [Sphingomonas bacterium]